jgi:hypothetical protein
MQTFINCLLDQCRRYQLSAELILVEWNPPSDQPRFSKILDWPQGHGVSVRIIEVPASLHQTLQHSDKLALFQMIAKNVGIRRARAPFILATNIDVLFSEELIAFFSANCLQEERMYRVDRFDVPAELPVDLPVDCLLEFCRQNVIRIHTRWGSKDAKAHCYLDGGPRWKAVIEDVCLVIAGKKREKRLHTNASGDFTLLSRAAWFRMRGYPELPALSMNIDGLGCQIAHFLGVRERVLSKPMQIYHIEHSIAPHWKAEGDGAARAMTDSDVPQFTYTQYKALAIQMRLQRRPVITNGETWGLGDRHLPETFVC